MIEFFAKVIRLRTVVALALTFAAACYVALSANGAEPMVAGVAESDITPPEKFPMAGYYHERLATGQRDPLKAKALVLRQGDAAVAWVVCDLTGVSRDLCLAVRRGASAKTGIRPEHIVVSATHSHTAPDYTKDLYDYLGGAAPDARRPPYAAKLIQGVVDAIVRAHETARPAQLAHGFARQETPVSFNRRFVMRDGSVRTWQRLDTPGVLRAAGPIDPEIGLLLIRDAVSQAPRGLVSNFALHLDTVGGLQWSGDFPYFIEQAVRRQLGDAVVSLFGAGTCGDINHSDPVAKERLKTDAIGNSLATSILPVLPQLSPVDVAPADSLPLQVRTAVVPLPLQEIAEEHLERAKQLIPAAKEGQKVEFFDLVSAYKAVVLDHLRNKPSRLKTTDYLSWGLSREWAGVGPNLPVEVTTVTLGREVAIVFLPGEVFVDLGLAIKRHSPYRTTLIVELSNCVETIYVPTRAAYAGGSYEVTNSNLQPGGGEMLVEAALKLLRESATSESPR